MKLMVIDGNSIVILWRPPPDNEGRTLYQRSLWFCDNAPAADGRGGP